LKFKGFDTNFGIENKVAVITGGANGIGYAIAQLFIEKGASVALFDLKEDVAAIAKELHQERAIGVLCNVTDNASMDDAIKQAHTHYGKIDILVGTGGKIINLASQAAIIALDNHVAYCASKAAVLGITRSLALEWAQFDINVNAISPTVILTELGKKAWAGEVGEQAMKEIPLGRFGYPEEVAAIALFLACDASNLITGENIVIDGGNTIK